MTTTATIAPVLELSSSSSFFTVVVASVTVPLFASPLVAVVPSPPAAAPLPFASSAAF